MLPILCRLQQRPDLQTHQQQHFGGNRQHLSLCWQRRCRLMLCGKRQRLQWTGAWVQSGARARRLIASAVPGAVAFYQKWHEVRCSFVMQAGAADPACEPFMSQCCSSSTSSCTGCTCASPGPSPICDESVSPPVCKARLMRSLTQPHCALANARLLLQAVALLTHISMRAGNLRCRQGLHFNLRLRSAKHLPRWDLHGNNHI